MTYRVLIRNNPANGYTATALAWPGCVVEAPTREEALAGIQSAIVELLNTSEIVEMELPNQVSDDMPAQHSGFGMFRDDPTFDEFIQEMQKYRESRNQIETK